MAMIRFSCPHCHATLVAQPKHVGREAPCKQCRKSVRVPESPMAQIASVPSVQGEPVDESPLRRSTLTRKVLFSGMAIFLLLVGFTLGRKTAPQAPDVSAEKENSTNADSHRSVASLTNGEPRPGGEEEQLRQGADAGQRVAKQDGADLVEQESLLRSLGEAQGKLLTPTGNEFKRRKALEDYLATLNSYRGKRVRLYLSIGSVSSKGVYIGGLATSPQGKYSTQVLVGVDFSGKDWGSDLYIVQIKPISRPNQRESRSLPHARGFIPSASFTPEVLQRLETGQRLLVAGQIVSLTLSMVNMSTMNEEQIRSSIKTHGWVDPNIRLVLSLKTERITVLEP